MIFSSIAFLCLYFPVTFLLHTVIPNTKIRNGILVAASLVFYAYGEPVYILLLLVSVLLNYLAGLLLQKSRKKSILALAVIVNIALLVVFKYAGFLTETLNALLPASAALPVPKLRLPIGISFYTFQALSYVVDVYRKETPVQKNYFRLLLYISFFPQLIAGPIVKYHDIAAQITERKVTADGIQAGLLRFAAGLGKKVLIANTMAYVADKMFALQNAEVGVLAAWIGALAYLMQIYFDFSGYSDMAIGLGKIYGFDFLENFQYPYISGSIQEFWRRWHISLSTWFKDYLYIPLGGNRKGKLRTVWNKYVVFFCTGIWHGANWTFLIWGLFHGTLQMLEQYGIIPVKKGIKWFNHIYTLLAVTIGFVIFRADNLTQAGYFIRAMFGFGTNGGAGYAAAVMMLQPYYIFIFVLAVIGCTPIVKKTYERISQNAKTEALPVIRMFLALVVLVLTILCLASNSYNPFIYFRF